jgi:hypothetical protein
MVQRSRTWLLLAGIVVAVVVPLYTEVYYNPDPDYCNSHWTHPCSLHNHEDDFVAVAFVLAVVMLLMYARHCLLMPCQSQHTVPGAELAGARAVRLGGAGRYFCTLRTTLLFGCACSGWGVNGTIEVRLSIGSPCLGVCTHCDPMGGRGCACSAASRARHSMWRLPAGVLCAHTAHPHATGRWVGAPRPLENQKSSTGGWQWAEAAEWQRLMAVCVRACRSARCRSSAATRWTTPSRSCARSTTRAPSLCAASDDGGRASGASGRGRGDAQGQGPLAIMCSACARVCVFVLCIGRCQ